MNDHIKQYAQTWVNNILNKYEQKISFTTLPICEKTLSRIIEEIQGITITIEPDDKASLFDEGLLIPVRGGFKIKYGTINKNQKYFHGVKIRETICHELAHIAFYDCTSPIPELKTKPPEYLCHDMARQLLLPDRIVREKFSGKITTNSDLISIIEDLSREFQVPIILIVRKILEDLALLNDTMITIWKYKPREDRINKKESTYSRYSHNPKLSDHLRNLLPKYWRDQIHIEAWEKVVSKVAIGKSNDLPLLLHIEGKRKTKEGKIKNIRFEIQCESLYNKLNNLIFNSEENIISSLNLISVKKFDMDMLNNGK